MLKSSTVVEDFVVIGVQPDAIQVRGSDGQTLELSASELSDVLDSVIRLTFRANPSTGLNNSSVPIVLNAVVSLGEDGTRQRVEVFQLKLARG